MSLIRKGAKLESAFQTKPFRRTERPSVPKAPAGVCLAEPSPSDTPPPNLWHLWSGLSEVALAGGQIVRSSHLTAILRHFQIPSPPASNLCQSAPKANACTDGCGSAGSYLLLASTFPNSTNTQSSNPNQIHIAQRSRQAMNQCDSST